MKSKSSDASIFKTIENIEYFDFEEDFVEKNVRCIPMIVRFKMDAAGVKLKLSEWSLFSVQDRIELATLPCETETEVRCYRNYLSALIKKYTSNEATDLTIDCNPGWKQIDDVPVIVIEKAAEFNWKINAKQWKDITALQRYALLKLCRPGHENRNFPKAMIEFNLINQVALL